MDKHNPWHRVAVGEQAPYVVNGIIEIPKNTRAKYELDKESGLLKMDRVLFSSINYPQNYGFIPQTYCDDQGSTDIYGEKGALCEDFGESKEEEVVVFNSSEI